MALREFGISCWCVDIAEHSIWVVIPPGVLLVRRDIILKFVLWTLAPRINMPLEMMKIAILLVIWKPCWWNLFATPAVAMRPDNGVISCLCAGRLFKCVGLQYTPEYLDQPLSACLPLLNPPCLRMIAVQEWNWQESDHYNAVRWGHLADFGWFIGSWHIYRPRFLNASNIREMCSVRHEDHSNQWIPHSEGSVDVD